MPKHTAKTALTELTSSTSNELQAILDEIAKEKTKIITGQSVSELLDFCELTAYKIHGVMSSFDDLIKPICSNVDSLVSHEENSKKEAANLKTKVDLLEKELNAFKERGFTLEEAGTTLVNERKIDLT
jgi:hypothetical protein